MTIILIALALAHVRIAWIAADIAKAAALWIECRIEFFGAALVLAVDLVSALIYLRLAGNATVGVLPGQALWIAQQVGFLAVCWLVTRLLQSRFVR